MAQPSTCGTHKEMLGIKIHTVDIHLIKSLTHNTNSCNNHLGLLGVVSFVLLQGVVAQIPHKLQFISCSRCTVRGKSALRVKIMKVDE